jgi:hypothetical protein
MDRDELRKLRIEAERIANIAGNTHQILDDLDREFERCSGLTKKDVAFLFTAVAMQVARQYLLTAFPERLDDQAAAKKVKGNTEEHSNRSHTYYNPSLNEILTNPVPFDANIGANGALAGGGKLGHRVTALGHDPILGLIVGTANIATSTLTNSKGLSYHITTNNNRDCFKNQAQTPLVFAKTGDKLLNQGLEGKRKVGSSLVKEIIHLRTDIHTKNSLPLPVISTIDPKMASQLAERGLDMSNVATVGKQATMSILINALIAMIHGAFYDNGVDGSKKVYEVRTRKILSYSNLIASASNLAYVGISAANGNEAAIRKLDLGGLMVTCYRIATDSKFIREAKREFIEQEYFAMIRGV